MNQDEVSLGYKKVTAAEKKVAVAQYFDMIARRYDLADTFLSFGLHHVWKQRAVKLLGLQKGELVLDVCGGTADLALRAAALVRPEGLVVGYDMSRAMMEMGRVKVKRSREALPILFVQGDAERISFPEATFDAVMVGFGLRNLAHPLVGLQEIFRVLCHGGRLACLEFSLPTSPLLRSLYQLYSFTVMPRAGKWITGAREPFAYLVESIRTFPPPEQIVAMLGGIGFSTARFQTLSGGLAVVYLAVKG
jgi:demethylmenaquinone methyltransferase / 2-methoxy-6-polyprenyl-1,4-benzoquinol methylase